MKPHYTNTNNPIDFPKMENAMNKQIQKLIESTVEVLDRDPLSQSEDTYSILLEFTQALATEIGEIVVASPYMEGTRMYFDEKIARYEIKKSVGL
jgi:hypothetical protein